MPNIECRSLEGSVDNRKWPLHNLSDLSVLVIYNYGRFSGGGRESSHQDWGQARRPARILFDLRSFWTLNRKLRRKSNFLETKTSPHLITQKQLSSLACSSMGPHICRFGSPHQIPTQFDLSFEILIWPSTQPICPNLPAEFNIWWDRVCTLYSGPWI